MGYCADVSGMIIAKSVDDALKVKEVLDDIEEWDYWVFNAVEFQVSAYGRYHEDSYYELFKRIKDFVTDFSFECVGEDHQLWGFFRDETAPSGFVEKEGRVVYD